MIRIRSAALAATVAVLGATGCGGSAATPPPAAAPVPAQTTTASTQGSAGVSADIGKEQAAAERSLRTWGQAASRACRKSQRRMKPWEGRLREMTSQKPTRARAVALGKVVASGARAAEYEYDLLRAIQLPAQADAVHTIYTFLEMEEEALRLVQRLGAEFTALDDLEGIVFTARRFSGLADDYRRAAKAAHAGACA